MLTDVHMFDSIFYFGLFCLGLFCLFSWDYFVWACFVWEYFTIWDRFLRECFVWDCSVCSSQKIIKIILEIPIDNRSDQDRLLIGTRFLKNFAQLKKQ